MTTLAQMVDILLVLGRIERKIDDREALRAERLAEGAELFLESIGEYE